MQDETRLTPSEREIEAALGGLRPARAPMNRDRLMFCAGRTSARRQNHIWQGVSACLGLVLLVSVMNRPAATSVETGTNAIANDTRDTLPLDSKSQLRDSLHRERFGSISDYVRMRRAVLNKGIEALPAPSPVPSTFDEPLMRERTKRVPSST